MIGPFKGPSQCDHCGISADFNICIEKFKDWESMMFLSFYSDNSLCYLVPVRPTQHGMSKSPGFSLATPEASRVLQRINKVTGKCWWPWFPGSVPFAWTIRTPLVEGPLSELQNNQKGYSSNKYHKEIDPFGSGPPLVGSFFVSFNILNNLYADIHSPYVNWGRTHKAFQHLKRLALTS